MTQQRDVEEATAAEQLQPGDVGAVRLDWRPRPDRRWGWVAGDWEIEWRRAEADYPAGYYLFGPGVFGGPLGAGRKDEVQAAADRAVGRSRGQR